MKPKRKPKLKMMTTAEWDKRYFAEFLRTNFFTTPQDIMQECETI